MNNNHAGSGVDYGLDLHDPGRSAGVFTDALPLAIANADIRMSNEVCVINGATAPVDGTEGTGAGFAGPGSLYVQTASGVAVYVNTNTKASPTWVELTQAS
jgi:hypothetical protein